MPNFVPIFSIMTEGERQWPWQCDLSLNREITTSADISGFVVPFFICSTPPLCSDLYFILHMVDSC